MCLSGVMVFTATSRAVSVLKIKYFFKEDHNMDLSESSRSKGVDIKIWFDHCELCRGCSWSVPRHSTSRVLHIFH